MSEVMDFVKAALPWIVMGLCVAVVLAKMNGKNRTADNADPDNKSVNDEEEIGNYGALGMCFGISLGLLLGNLTGMGTSGMCLGMLMGLAVGTSIKKKKQEE